MSSSVYQSGTVAIGRITAVLDRHWRGALVAIILMLETALFASQVPLRGGRPWVGIDSFAYQYMGWYWTAHGGIPYLEVWEVKPPLAYEVPALLAFVTGDNMVALYAASAGLTIAALIGGVLLAGTLVEEYTGDGLAALAAGLVVLSYPYMFKQAAWGFRPKPLLVVCGLTSFYFLLHERWMFAGAAGAAAAGFWQLGIVFPVIAIVGGFRNGRQAGLHALAGAALVTAAVVAPFVLAGPMAVRAMVAEVVFAPLLDPPSFDIVARILRGGRWLDFANPTVFVGGMTALLAWRLSGRTWWLSVAAVWFGFQALYLDFGGQTDLVVGMAIAGIGYGFLVGHLDERWRVLLVVAAVAALTLNIWNVGFSYDYIHPQMQALDPGTLKYYYWNAVPPETCHVRRAGDEYTFVRALGGSWEADVCGQYSLSELLRAI